MAKNINLAAKAKKQAEDIEIEEKITEETLLDRCPKEFLKLWKSYKTPAQRADFLYQYENGCVKEAKQEAARFEDFSKAIRLWFTQELKNGQTGVTGKFGRVEIEKKEVPQVQDWTKFYAYIKKTGAFDLLGKGIKSASIEERWEAGKKIPGVGKFNALKVSLTKVSGKK